jgi:GDSL-like Lipase/Acylhydrolase family
MTKQTNILIFGDSNTWGHGYEEPFDNRLDGRWSNLLSANQKYNIIEEGLPARVAGNIDFSRPVLNGFDYFKACFLSHSPLDIIIIALGGNDLKFEYEQMPEDIMASLEMYEIYVRSLGYNGKVIFLLQPYLNLGVISGRYKFCNDKLTDLYALFRMSKLDFVDLNRIIVADDMPDGIHYTPEAHTKIAGLVRDYLEMVKVNKN